jgi:hypothetical protein
MRRYIILGSGLLGVGAVLLWWMLQPPPGIELKGPQETASTVTLITAIVGLLTSVVTLATTLVKGRTGGS